MRQQRAFRLDKELWKEYDSICVRHGDQIYYMEEAIRDIILKKKGPAEVKVPAKEIAVSKPKKVSSKFITPTIAELRDHFILRGCSDRHEPAKFMDHFNSNGWKVGGKATMKCWKSAVNSWVGRNKSSASKSSSQASPDQSGFFDNSQSSALGSGRIIDGDFTSG